MSHLWGRGWCAVIILDHTIVKLRRHCDNHMIIVRIEISTLWNIKSERWVIVITSQKVIWVVDQSRVVRGSLGKIWWPNTKVSILGLMDSHVWWPHSVVDNSLSKVPLLEEVTSVFLMGWMKLWKVDHLRHELNLGVTLVDNKIIFLMHGSVATLACSLEDLETSSKGSRVVSLEADLRWPVRVTVVHTNRVDLFFITLDTIWGTNIISEKPGLCLRLSTKE
jgi:hypothetical protein